MIVSVALAFLAASAAPADAAAQPQPAPAAKKVKEKKICRSDEAVTGSLFPQRTCKTKAEWDAERAAEQRNSNRQSQAAGAGDSN